MDEQHALEGVSWDQPEDTVTDKGLQTIKNAAEEFKNDYIGNLLDSSYDPGALYVRAQYETVPFTDAAAFVMTTYPDTADGADIMLGFTALDATSMPISQDDLQSIRQRLSLGLPTASKQNIDIYPGNPDLMFIAHVFDNFPAWREQLQQMITSSLSVFEGHYPNFMQEIKKALDKEDDDLLTLGNAIFYLDYYYASVDNGKNPSKASITGDLERQVKEYYKAMFDTGLFGKDSYNRVLANGYLKHVVN